MSMYFRTKSVSVILFRYIKQIWSIIISFYLIHKLHGFLLAPGRLNNQLLSSTNRFIVWCRRLSLCSTMYMYALSVLFTLLVLQAINFEHLKTEGQFLSNSSTLIFDLHFGLLGSCRLGFTGSSVSMTLIYR